MNEVKWMCCVNFVSFACKRNKFKSNFSSREEKKN